MFLEYFTFKDFFIFLFFIIPQPVFDKYNLIELVATCRKCPIFTIWSYKSYMSAQIKSRIKKKRKSVWWIFCESSLGIIMTLHANMLSHQFGGIYPLTFVLPESETFTTFALTAMQCFTMSNTIKAGFYKSIELSKAVSVFLGIDFVTFACLVCCLLLFISGNQCCCFLFLFCLCQLMNCGVYSIWFQLKLLNLKHSQVMLVCWPSTAMPLVSAHT